MKQTNIKYITKVNGFQKLIFSIVLSAIAYIILLFFHIELPSRIILAWDTFCISMIVLSWALFFATTYEDLCSVVEKQDEGLKVIFAIVLVAVCFSLFGTLVLLTEKNETSYNKIFHTIISISPVLLSWILLHTIFAIRYSHLYHDHNKFNTGSQIGGIDFPTKLQPDYIDFAYFSFIIGMTFQVSNVSVSSRVIRRFVLMHSLISFVFNTIIVALIINTIAGLNK